MGRVPSTVIELTDLRQQPLDELPQRVEDAWKKSKPALLTLSHRPSKRWVQQLDFAHPLRLSSAPLYELILWVPTDTELRLPNSVEQEQKELLEGYKQLFEKNADEQRYLELLGNHVRSQEEDFYPLFAQLIPAERALRELCYEHRGLEKEGLKLSATLAHHRSNSLSRQARERLDLDFFHLLEHHLERERDALFPAWIFISEIQQRV